MNTAITWVMTKFGDRPRSSRYLLLDHVLVVVDFEVGDSHAIAQAFDSAANARNVALDHTRADEAIGSRLDGSVVTIQTNLSPEKMTKKYDQRRAVGPGLGLLLTRLSEGRGEPL